MLLTNLELISNLILTKSRTVILQRRDTADAKQKNSTHNSRHDFLLKFHVAGIDRMACPEDFSSMWKCQLCKKRFDNFCTFCLELRRSKH